MSDEPETGKPSGHANLSFGSILNDKIVPVHDSMMGDPPVFYFIQSLPFLIDSLAETTATDPELVASCSLPIRKNSCALTDPSASRNGGSAVAARMQVLPSAGPMDCPISGAGSRFRRSVLAAYPHEIRFEDSFSPADNSAWFAPPACDKSSLGRKS